MLRSFSSSPDGPDGPVSIEEQDLFNIIVLK